MNLNKLPIYSEVSFVHPVTKAVLTSKIYATEYSGIDSRTWQVQVKISEGCLVWKPLMDMEAID